MKCNKCGGRMIHMEVNKNKGRKFEDWEPETYICEECDDVIYI